MSFAALMASAPALALSPPPPQPDDHFLPALYEAMDGDNWTRNDGWLDPEVHWCDWYGVTCGEEIWPGFSDFARLDLSGNNLTGQFNEELIEYFSTNRTLPENLLDLSDNQIEGQLPRLPANIQQINLAHNQLSGPLPEPLWVSHIPEDSPDAYPLQILNLADNQFSGSIPGVWTQSLSLSHLNLSNNELEGGIAFAVEAMRSEPGSSWIEPDTEPGLWLADNDFSGKIDPAWFEDMDLAGINLCWTDLEIDDPALDEWIAERHWGGSHHQCLGRERLALDPTVSGSWYDIHRPGEGFSLMLLEDGTPLVYWFSHIADNRQLWLFNSGSSDATTAHIRPLIRTRGEFDLGFNDIDNPMFGRGALRLDRVGPQRLHAEFRVGYSYYDIPPYGSVIITPPPMPDTGFRSDHYQLTRLAGSTCDNTHPLQWISGAWYNPERSGEGFILEVNDDGRGIVYWFSYTPEGTNDDSDSARSGDWQTWMTGDGQFEGSSLVIENLLQPRDTASGMPGDTSGIENQPWGSLRLDFHDDLSGEIFYDSDIDGYGSGSYPIERLARPMLAECG